MVVPNETKKCLDPIHDTNERIFFAKCLDLVLFYEKKVVNSALSFLIKKETFFVQKKEVNLPRLGHAKSLI